ncbi:hypothetical protein EG329_004856 [Mollisiaceae sp. DMI_Dod_QoI]|nr:hypothetical protein EG329_004856 [Helotiales sp. DMI_Dod_QoI]
MRRMYLSWLLYFLMFEQVLGQALLSILQSTPATLSTLNSFINSSTTLKSLLSTANNFTFLAPNNDAFKNWLAEQGSTPSQDIIDATITYHLLNGGFPTVLFSSTPRIVPSNLKDPKFANVTTGQAVELLSAGKASEFISGSKTVSTITSPDIVCTGGLIHVIDTVLNIPQALVSAITQANLTFLIGILNQGGYLNAADQPLVLPVLDASNVTFFLPNTASALAAFTSFAANASQSELGDSFNYHVIPNFLGYSSDLKNGMVLKTAQGSKVTITIRGNETFVNQAKIISSDLLVANGVVHTIDSLLDQNNITTPPPLPPAQTQGPTTPGTSPASTLNTTTKIGIAVAGSVGLVLISSLAGFYIRWLQRRRAADGPPVISGPYVQELEGGGRNYHGYKEEELVDSGTTGKKNSSYEDKRVEFVASAVELDGRERSRSRNRGRPERVAKPFF